jgi:hypothetical protein
MTFVACAVVPQFDSRDVFCGSTIRSISADLATQEAAAKVCRALNQHEAGEPMSEIYFEVFERAADGRLVRLPDPPAVACGISYDDDIEF